MDLPFPSVQLVYSSIFSSSSSSGGSNTDLGWLKWKTQVCTEELQTSAHPHVQRQSGPSLKKQLLRFCQRQPRHLFPLQLLTCRAVFTQSMKQSLHCALIVSMRWSRAEDF